jgi:hypothetical protein
MFAYSLYVRLRILPGRPRLGEPEILRRQDFRSAPIGSGRSSPLQGAAFLTTGRAYRELWQDRAREARLLI